MEIVSLGSGSKGNSMYVGFSNVNILVDVGLSMKKVNWHLLTEVGIDLEDIDSIFITHAHGDHVRSLHTIVKQYPHIKVVMPEEVYEEYTTHMKKYIPKESRVSISFFKPIEGKHLRVEAFEVNHDTKAFAYKFTDLDNGEKYMHLADNGGIKSKKMVDRFIGCTYYAIESNYDRNTELFHPTRPDLTKRRTLGYYGHTENGDAIEFANRVVTTETKGIIFHHLSEECNTEDLAMATHLGILTVFGNKTKFKNIRMVYAKQDEPVRLK